MEGIEGYSPNPEQSKNKDKISHIMGRLEQAAAKPETGKKTVEKVVSNKFSGTLLYTELMAHIGEFDAETQRIIRKKATNQKLSDDENAKFNASIPPWWKAEYGFNFTDRTQRDALLAQKYPDMIRSSDSFVNATPIKMNEKSSNKKIAGKGNVSPHKRPEIKRQIERKHRLRTLNDLLKNHIAEFSYDLQQVILQDEPIATSLFQNEFYRWWKRRYGIDFTNKEQRKKILLAYTTHGQEGEKQFLIEQEQPVDHTSNLTFPKETLDESKARWKTERESISAEIKQLMISTLESAADRGILPDNIKKAQLQIIDRISDDFWFNFKAFMIKGGNRLTDITGFLFEELVKVDPYINTYKETAMAVKLRELIQNPTRFGINTIIRSNPDLVAFDEQGKIQGIIECKSYRKNVIKTNLKQFSNFVPVLNSWLEELKRRSDSYLEKHGLQVIAINRDKLVLSDQLDLRIAIPRDEIYNEGITDEEIQIDDQTFRIYESPFNQGEIRLLGEVFLDKFKSEIQKPKKNFTPLQTEAKAA